MSLPRLTDTSLTPSSDTGFDRAFFRMQNAMNRVVSDFAGDLYRPAMATSTTLDFPSLSTGIGMGMTRPLVDVTDLGKEIKVHAELPGVPKENVTAQIDRDGNLILCAETQLDAERQEGTALVRERRRGRFYRTVPLPDNVDAENIEARFENGVLEMTIPKTDVQAGTKRIDIQ